MVAEGRDADVGPGGRKIAEEAAGQEVLWRCTIRLRLLDSVVNLSDHAMTVMLRNAP